MRIGKTVVTNLNMPYAISILANKNAKFVIAGSEGVGPCITFSPESLATEPLSGNFGGTMNFCQLDDNGSFLAIQEFYKGFNSKTACIIKAIKDTTHASWSVERYIELPYVHRFCIITVQDKKFILAATLCDSKESKDDWTKPGRVYLGELPPNLNQPCSLRPIISGITKNHGMYFGQFDGRKVVMVSGMEGIFAIDVPDTPSGDWTYRQIINREVSDLIVFDIDQDGEDELITIEKFHGNRLTINKRVDNEWQIVYSYPIAFGHVLWGGNILGRASLILGYRDDNGALLIMQKKAGPEYSMDITMIDENESPCNIAVLESDSKIQIFATNGRTQRVVRYDITQ